MPYFAEVNPNDVVLRVIVADQAFIDSGKVGDKSSWVETVVSQHYASINYKYDRPTNFFICPKPYDSWVFNKQLWVWDPPINYPKKAAGFIHVWDELNIAWIKKDEGEK